MSKSGQRRPEKDPRNKTEPGPRRAHALVLLPVLGGLLLAPLLFKPWIHGNDPVKFHAYCRSLWLDGDWDFRNEFEHYSETGEMQRWFRDPETGRAANGQGYGTGLLWSPFFLAGHAVALLGPAEADGYSRPYAWAISLGTLCYGLAGLGLLGDLLCRRFGPRVAAAACAAAALGSPLWFYLYLHPSMSHGCSFFLCCLLLWVCERWAGRLGVGRCLLVGLLAGLLIVTRWNNGIFMLYALVWWLRGARGAGRVGVALRGALAGGLGIAIALAPQLIAWRYMHGSFFSGPRSFALDSNLSIWQSPHFFELLFSGRRGLFVWSPLLLGGLAGALALAGRERRPGDIVYLLMFLAQAWVIGGWFSWWGGASFGQRFFINCLPLFALGLGWLYREAGRRGGGARTLAAALTLLCLLWSGGLAVQYVGRLVPREDDIALRRLVHNQFHAVPRWLAGNLELLTPRARMERQD